MRNDKSSFQWECQVCFSLSFFTLLQVHLCWFFHGGALSCPWLLRNITLPHIISSLDCESRKPWGYVWRLKDLSHPCSPFHKALGRCQRAHFIGVSAAAAFAINKPETEIYTLEYLGSFYWQSQQQPVVPSPLFFFSFLKEIKCKRYVSTALKLRFRHVFQCYDSHSNCNSVSLHILLQDIKINITLYTAEYITTALRNTVAIWEKHLVHLVLSTPSSWMSVTFSINIELTWFWLVLTVHGPRLARFCTYM